MLFKPFPPLKCQPFISRNRDCSFDLLSVSLLNLNA